VDKPAGIPTIADHAGSGHSLAAGVARALQVPLERVHPTSRLDRHVSGVVVFALSRAAAARVAAARAAGQYFRRYVAIAERTPATIHGEWNEAIGRSVNPRLRQIGGRDAVPSRTLFAVSGTAPSGHALLALSPISGRTHQIRVHAAHAGAPLVGDKAYGASGRVLLPGGKVIEPGRIALHARLVRIVAERGDRLEARAPVPSELADLWAVIGGEFATWEVAASCVLEHE
jgi:23S rRNA-/tRNA-specific pseudouridylate synthase